MGLCQRTARFCHILRYRGPVVAIGSRSLFGNPEVGYWQQPAREGPRSVVRREAGSVGREAGSVGRGAGSVKSENSGKCEGTVAGT